MTIKAEGEYLYRFVATLFFIVQVSNWKLGSRGLASVFEVLIEGVCVMQGGGQTNAGSTGSSDSPSGATVLEHSVVWR